MGDRRSFDVPRRSVGRNGYRTATILLCLVAASLRMLWLLSSDLPFGRDGYYYVLELNSFRSGHLAIPSSALVPLALMTAARSTGLGDVLTIKLLAVLASLSLTLGAALFGRVCTGRWETGLAAAVFTAAASQHNVFVIEFVNNLFGMTFVVWTAVALAATRRATPRMRRLLGAAAFTGMVCALLSHVSAALALLVGGVTCLAIEVARGQAVRHHVVVALGCAIVPTLVLTSRVDWAAVTQSVAVLPSLDLWHHMSGSYSVILWAAVLSIGWVVVSARKRNESWELWGDATTVVVALLAVGIAFAANPFFVYHYSPYTVADRLGLWGWLIAGVIVPLLAFPVGSPKPSALACTVILGLSVLTAGTAPGVPPGADRRFLAMRKELVRALERVSPDMVRGSTVIAGHGDQFAVSYSTGARARTTRPHGREGEILWLIRSAGKDPTWPDGAMELGAYALIPDQQFHAWIAGLPADVRKDVGRNNPFHVGQEVLHMSARDFRRQ